MKQQDIGKQSTQQAKQTQTQPHSSHRHAAAMPQQAVMQQLAQAVKNGHVPAAELEKLAAGIGNAALQEFLSDSTLKTASFQRISEEQEANRIKPGELRLAERVPRLQQRLDLPLFEVRQLRKTRLSGQGDGVTGLLLQLTEEEAYE